MTLILPKKHKQRNLYLRTNNDGIHEVEINNQKTRMRGVLSARHKRLDEKTGITKIKLKRMHVTDGYVEGNELEESLLIYATDNKTTYRIRGVREPSKPIQEAKKKSRSAEVNIDRDVFPPLTEEERVKQKKLRQEYAALRMQHDAGDDPKISIAMVCAITSRSRPTIYRDIKAGRFRIIKVGESSRISYASVVKYMSGKAIDQNRLRNDGHEDASVDLDGDTE